MSHFDAAAGLGPAVRSGNSDVWRLAVAQALAGANAAVVYATGAIAGNTLAPTSVLATVPISLFVVGMAACTLPAGSIAQRHGRRLAFLAGTGCGVLAGLLAALGVVLGWFWLFCAATFFGGAYAAVVLSFRFAAADCVAPERRPRALSAVMAGSVFAGIIGPQLVTYTMHLWQPHLFAATFLAQAAVAAVSALVLLGVRVPMPTVAERLVPSFGNPGSSQADSWSPGRSRLYCCFCHRRGLLGVVPVGGLTAASAHAPNSHLADFLGWNATGLFPSRAYTVPIFWDGLSQRLWNLRRKPLIISFFFW